MVVLHQKKISLFCVQKIGQLNSRIGFSNSVVQLMNLIVQLMNLLFFKHKIFLKVIGGECKSATDEITSFWNETTLPTILSNYKLQAIFNADQFGLFYQCLSNKTYHLKRGKFPGAKKSKVRKTEMATRSATGKKFLMFIIGKLKNPRCFKNVKKYPVSMFHKRRVKWTVKSWKAGFLNLIGNSV